jgi:cytochrome c oxidase subunit 3
MWFALAPIVMLFTAFTSAYVVRQGLSQDWTSTDLPSIVWWNSLILLASSGAMEMARRKARGIAGRSRSGMVAWPDLSGSLRRWLLVTSVLGMGFLAGQIEAWRQLARKGIYLATNPSSSFFYLLTATHGLHLLGGVAALLAITALVARRLTPGRRTGVAVTAIYWHFMDLLWIYVLLLMTVLR